MEISRKKRTRLIIIALIIVLTNIGHTARFINDKYLQHINFLLNGKRITVAVPIVVYKDIILPYIRNIKEIEHGLLEVFSFDY